MSRQNSKASASGNPTATELVNLNEVEPIRSTCGGLYRKALETAVDGVSDRNFEFGLSERRAWFAASSGSEPGGCRCR